MGRSAGGKWWTWGAWGACWCLFAVTSRIGGKSSLWVEARTSAWSEPSPLGLFGVDARTFQETEATATATLTAGDVVDLSYQSHVSPDQLVKRLAAQLLILGAKKKEHDPILPSVDRIDVSHNPGLRMTDVWHALASLPSPVLTPISISARSCHIQSSDAAACLTQMAQAAKDNENTTHTNTSRTGTSNLCVPSLDLGFNPDLGSTTAFSKALQDWILAPTRTVINTPVSHNEDNSHVNERVLRLDACDAGAQALAMALEDNPGCIRSLILRNNRHVTDKGVAFLGRGLQASAAAMADANTNTISLFEKTLYHLDVSHNTNIGTVGAMAIAQAMAHGALHSASLCSCSIGADGAAAFGAATAAISMNRIRHSKSHSHARRLYIDLSGNPLGIFRPPSKQKNGALLMKSKASATTKTYVNFIGKKIQTGLKDYAGLDTTTLMGPSTVESDDDEEDDEDNDNEEGQSSGNNKKLDASKARCGAKSFVDAVLSTPIVTVDDTETDTKEESSVVVVVVVVGMRHCALDEGAADALAAAIQHQGNKKQKGLQIQWHMDTSMNAGLSDDSMAALWNVNDDDIVLRSMAQRHLVALEAFQRARERADAERALLNARNPWDRQTTYQDDSDYNDNRDDHNAFGNNAGQYDNNIYGNDEYDSDEYNY
eukprot:scaffold36094_cov59-Attheya_sp.AAC.1